MNINKKNKSIQSNIELLRIFSMIIIIAHHAIVHGILKRKDVWKIKNERNILIVKIFNSAGKISNAIFFIICGYFHIKKEKINLNSIIWKTCFYGFIISVIGKRAKFYKIYEFNNIKNDSKINLLRFNPVTSGIYWFVTTYIVLIAFSLELNKFLNQLNKKGYISFLLFFYIIWYFISYYYNSVYFELKSAIFFYSIGGYLKIYPKNKNLLNLIIFFIIGLIGYYFTMDTKLNKKLLKFYFLRNIVIKNRYIDLVGVPLSSFGFFNFFNLLNIKNCNIINALGKSCFAVYLIHDSFVFRIIIWKYISQIQKKYPQKDFPLIFIKSILKIFFICSLIDIIQQNLIEIYVLKLFKKIFLYLKIKFSIKNEQISKKNI